MAEAVSKQSIEGEAKLHLNACSKVQEESKDLKVELGIKSEADIKHLENSQPDHIIKIEKACSEENTKYVAK